MPFSGPVTVLAQQAGFVAGLPFAGSSAGVVAALAYAGTGGLVVVGPGDLTVTDLWTIPTKCELRLGGGTYTFSGASGISIGLFSILRGKGYGMTSLKPDATFSSSALIVNTDTTGGQQAAFVYSLEINGNKSVATCGKGIYFKGIGQPSVIRDCVIFNVSGVGIYLEGISSNAGSGCSLDNIWVNASNDHNIVLTGKFGAYTMSRVSTESVAAGKAGLFIDGTASDTVQGAVWLKDFHVEVLPSTAIGVLISSAHDITIDNIRYFGSGGTGDLIKITGLAADSYNILIRGAYDRFNALANTVNDVTNSVTLQNQVPLYYVANPRFQGNVTVTGTTDITGNLTARGASNQFGTAGTTHVTQFGQGASGTDGADVIVRAGNSGTTKARSILQRNGQSDLLLIIDGTTELVQFRHALQFGTTAGAQSAYMTTAGKLRLGTSGTPVGGLELGNAGDLVLTVSALTDAATIATDASLGNVFTVTLGGNRTMGAPTNPHTGCKIVYIITQDGTGGRTLAWNAAFKTSWSDAGNTLNKVSTITFVYNGTNWIQVGAQSIYI